MFKKIRFYKALLIEIVETLCSICLYLESDSRRGAHNPHGVHMRSHFDVLKSFSEVMRGSKSPEEGTRPYE